ncbi:hypothetical protein HPB47_022405 [Ixodes persulcatus]|uniref:Uncharacterized protein n=1 Tax=Ixodes persulcatus TaxID=34615 RepID=A0AC60QA76_IXOPE|nr:hypothetical protein HPB47_022405 [Ixodes persulcatus]
MRGYDDDLRGDLWRGGGFCPGRPKIAGLTSAASHEGLTRRDDACPAALCCGLERTAASCGTSAAPRVNMAAQAEETRASDTQRAGKDAPDAASRAAHTPHSSLGCLGTGSEPVFSSPPSPSVLASRRRVSAGTSLGCKRRSHSSHGRSITFRRRAHEGARPYRVCGSSGRAARCQDTINASRGSPPSPVRARPLNMAPS